MIKGLPEFEDIKKMNFADLYKLEKSLKVKIRIRTKRHKNELEKANKTAERIPNPTTALERLEVQGDAFTAKGTNLEISILEVYLREVQKYLNKYRDYIKEHTIQPGNV